MANTAMGFTRVTVPISTKAIADMGGVVSGFATPANYVSVGALRARLAAANATYYTTAKLDHLTVNDMVFAVRSIDDKTTICDYMPTSTA